MSKKTFVMADSYVGVDWHDSHSKSKILSNATDFSVDDPYEAIIEDILSILPKKITSSLPSELVQAFVRKINTLSQDGSDDSKASLQFGNYTVCISRKNNVFNTKIEDEIGYANYTTYVISEINTNDLLYLPIRTAYASTKPMRSVDILLYPGFKNPLSCQRFLEHEKEVGLVRTYNNYLNLPDVYMIIPFRISELAENDWYREQLTILTKPADELLDLYKKEWENSNPKWPEDFKEFVFLKHLGAYKKVFN